MTALMGAPLSRSRTISTPAGRHRVVIIGAGFAGLAAAKALAVADFGRIRLSGRIAWLLWGGVHVLFLIGFRNRVAVTLDWLWAYVTFQRGARLIASEKPHV